MRTESYRLDTRASGISFVPADCWIGLYVRRRSAGMAAGLWNRAQGDYRRVGSRTVDRVDVFVCLVPMLPIRLVFVRVRPITEPPASADDMFRAGRTATEAPDRGGPG